MRVKPYGIACPTLYLCFATIESLHFRFEVVIVEFFDGVCCLEKREMLVYSHVLCK